ncbi:MAG: M20/M25/M40 family metallo-hydrolase, partial [Acidobacteriota bacterium]
MRRGVLVFLLAGVVVSRGWAAGIDWPRYQEETVDRLSHYLTINTANPPGNEMRATRYFKEWFAQEGIPSEVFEIAPGRANLVARLKGDGSKRPLIISNHVDVVNADSSAWKVAPFSGAIRDGRIYGRGALDMKGMGLLEAMVLVALHREGIPLSRDVVFVATADEEVGFGGAAGLVENKPDLIREAEFLITEGGQNLLEGKQVRFFGVDAAEKAPFWLRLVAEGTPGHGSRPKRDAASHRLVRALARVVDWETPITILPGVEKFFRDLARLEEPGRAEQFRHLRRAIEDPDFLRSLTEDDTTNYLLRDTVSLTVLKGAPQTNVIPGRAVAHLDVRLLPGRKPEEFLAQLREVIADPSIAIEVITDPFR